MTVGHSSDVNGTVFVCLGCVYFNRPYHLNTQSDDGVSRKRKAHEARSDVTAATTPAPAAAAGAVSLTPPLACAPCRLTEGAYIRVANTTLSEAIAFCIGNASCAAFTAETAGWTGGNGTAACTAPSPGIHQFFFKEDRNFGNYDATHHTWMKDKSFVSPLFACGAGGKCVPCTPKGRDCARVTYADSDCFGLCAGPPAAEGGGRLAAHANIMPNGSFVHYQGAIDGPNCCTQLPAAWRNRTAYKTPRSAFEKDNCFATCDQNPDCPAASAKWMPGSCKNATSGPGGSHPRSKFTVKHGWCTNKPDSDCCTNWCTF